jgi:hypothetical protein
MCETNAFDGAITIGRGLGARALAYGAWSQFRQITARSPWCSSKARRSPYGLKRLLQW